MFGHAMKGCGIATLWGLASLAVNRLLEANFNSMMLAAPQVWELTMGQRYAIAFITGAASTLLRLCARLVCGAADSL